MKIKQLYGNHQQVSETMMMELEKLQTMCNNYGLRLSCYVERHSSSLPIVLAVYEGGFALSQSNLCNETDFLECVSGQLTYIDFKYNESYKHN